MVGKQFVYQIENEWQILVSLTLDECVWAWAWVSVSVSERKKFSPSGKHTHARTHAVLSYFVELVAIVKLFRKFIVPLPDLMIFAEIAILLLIFYVAISFISLRTFFLLPFP